MSEAQPPKLTVQMITNELLERFKESLVRHSRASGWTRKKLRAEQKRARAAAREWRAIQLCKDAAEAHRRTMIQLAKERSARSNQL